jgi:hypothetical protein
VSRETSKEIDSSNLNDAGPPFSAANFWPLSSNSAVTTEPVGPGPVSG